MTESEPLEPDAIFAAPGVARGGRPVKPSPSAGPDADTGWLPAGFEVTRPSPPVGSFTFGMPGEGFFLVQPGEAAQFFPPGAASDQPPLSLDEAIEQAQRAAGMLDEADGPPDPDLGIIHDRTLD